MIGYRDVGGGGLDLRVAGTSEVTLLIGFGDQEVIVDDAFGQRSLGGFVAGLPIAPMRLRCERAECVEVRLSPLRAYSVLGIAPNELGRGAVDLEDLWGASGRRLREQLANADSWDERFELTRAFLAQSDRSARTPDPEVIDAWRRVLESHGGVRIGELASSLGWSNKRLWARFESQIGLTPKRAAMLVRFRHAVDGLLAGGSAAEVAAESGYADQAHLSRDVSIFTGRPPGALTTHYSPAIAQHRYRAWGKFFQYGGGAVAR
ncbi:helix-turn-helix domain-containing protein [Nocardia sp. CDC153]|uniref:helix-turn-helix domain-containing protein n=1 Tax=Nocardia sp. CDC153 TaxID=3112167 RepID=UPI002DBB7D90|nr:helix-turn-helix domain-containing protein [Nocardia sp. CDC153]MEC3957440.1 helix-turn-helix domain-containing protein [Nocardia sp. CDC153]